MRLILILLTATLLLSGCACGTVTSAPVSGVVPAPAAAPGCACEAAPALGYTLAAPSGALQLAAPTGVQFRTGPAEYARAGLGIPGDLIVCGSQTLAEVGAALGRGVKCAAKVLVPEVVPTATYTFAKPQAPAPAAAPPCAPQAPQYEWRLVPKAPAPPPPPAMALPPAGTCYADGTCVR